MHLRLLAPVPMHRPWLLMLALASPHPTPTAVQYTAPDNSQIHQLVAPGPAYAAALEVDPQQENGRFLEWAPALPKFRYITAVNPGDGQVQSLTPDFSILSAKGRVAAQSGAHALAAVFATDPEADLPNSELVCGLGVPGCLQAMLRCAPLLRDDGHPAAPSSR